jgi:predicted permease
MRAIGLWGPVAFVMPFLIFGKVAKWEQQWQPGLRIRRIGSLLLVLGSILLAAGLWRYERVLENRYADSFVPGPMFDPDFGEQPAVRRGPRNRPGR